MPDASIPAAAAGVRIRDDRHLHLDRHGPVDAPGMPVLLVPPPAAPVSCYHLRPGLSVRDRSELTPPRLAAPATAGRQHRTDAITPLGSAAHLTDLVPHVRFATAPGSHLGLLTGTTAPGTTWRHVDAFLDEAGRAG